MAVLDLQHDKMVIPARMIPGFRTQVAVQNGVEKKLLFRTWGGIGDQICAEPTLRYALDVFKGCEVFLASEAPELFTHLKFKRVYDLKREIPAYKNFLCIETITPPDDSNLVWQFIGHLNTHCVDFPSICALRSQLPISYREVRLVPQVRPDLMTALPKELIVIHAGKHWQSKTFPVSFWNAVIQNLIDYKVTPILIGGDADDNRGTVNVDTTGCIDLRNKLTLTESVYLLQRSHVLLTNDSSPLHMAATGNAWIGFIATCKHPDYITHWRQGQWGWRMKNHGKGGIWDVLDFAPNKAQTVSVENVGEELLNSWLPSPKEFAQWAISKL